MGDRFPASMRWAFRLLPWLMLLVILVVFATPPLRVAANVMFASGIAAAALSLFAFQTLLGRLVPTFSDLWDQMILGEGGPQPSPQREQFLRDLRARLNHRAQFVLAIAFALLVFTWYPLDFSSEPLRVPGLVIELAAAFLIGAMVWRMLIIGVTVWQLGSRLRVKPQLEHPDQCGGLEPLGGLCFWNALIISMAGIYLGGWLIIGPSTPPEYASLARYYRSLFTWLLLVPLFLPLWSLHQAMVRERMRVWKQLAGLGSMIDELANAVVSRADRAEPRSITEVAARLSVMRDVYQQYRKLPVWPFNVGTLLRFLTAQVVPLVGLASQVANLPIPRISLTSVLGP